MIGTSPQLLCFPFNFTRWGYTAEQWERGKRRAHRQLCQMACNQSDPLTYQQFLPIIQDEITFPIPSHLIALGSFLGQISEFEVMAGGAMLSVQVVNEITRRPGEPGFYDLARHLGRYRADDDTTFADELRRVREHYS